jgi:cytokinesis protein
VREAIRLNGIVTQIVSSLNSPHLPTRKLICEVLLSIIYISKDALSLVFPALENLTRSNEVPLMNDPNDKRNVPGYYDYWFRSLESALLGRGKMGSLVGASEEVRKGSGHDSSLQEYAVRFLYLPSGVVLNAYLVNQCFRDCSYHGHDRGHGYKVVPPLANGLCWSPAHHRFMS